MTDILTVKHVQKKFKRQTVLRDVSLTVPAGSIYALLGANGAGKTTLLRIITGLLPADQGQVTVKGLPLKTHRQEIQRLFSYSGQAATVDDILTGEENLTLIARLRHVAQPRTTAAELLAQFSLTNAAKKRVAAYSGGMRRRLDLAMSLVGEPEIIFLDEPTTGLDPSSRNDLWATIRELKQRGKTIFLTTQYLDEADELADQISFLRDGKIVATGTPSEMKRLAGPERLVLTFATPAIAATAADVLQGFGPQVKATEVSVTVANSVTTTLAVLTALASSKCQPTDFRLQVPTLDDVFLQLTKEA